ncbi:general secretion pathway protein H [Pseudomonas sp. IT-P12]|uniref:type II secretion system minor pseudopilin GspH n=1 Tax=Pseudomonas sp. IT-P12 TaxID=3026450 RepID=UPI0039DF69C1
MRQGCRGFTLLEMMIVIVLIGALLGMVSLAAGPDPQRQARYQVHALAGMIQHMRERAVLEGREYGIRLSDSGYRAMRLEAREWKPMAALQPWPDGLRVQLDKDGHPLRLDADAGLPQVLMLSSDETSAFTLTFTVRGRTLLHLSGDGLGEVVIDG